MNRKQFATALLLSVIASSAFAQPTLTVTPGGIQSGNWVWDVSVTPDLTLVSDGATPMAVELGFRLTGAPLLSVTNVNPSEWDYSLPGNSIFGWEIPYPESNNHPEGIEANCTGCTVINPAPSGGHPATIVPGTNNEIFVALGSVVFTTPGPKALLRIVGKGPGNGGSTFSSIQWLGAYAGGNGRISQLVYDNGLNFDVFSGFEAYLGLASQSFTPGDMNGDGVFTDDVDIPLFVYMLLGENEQHFQTERFSICDDEQLTCELDWPAWYGGDSTNDHLVTIDDIPGFQDAIAGAGYGSGAFAAAVARYYNAPPSVPEPASALLLCSLVAPFAGARCRRD